MDRYAPKLPYPVYAFVPGKHPHPVTDSRGHSFGQDSDVPLPLDPQSPHECMDYLFAIDLFNAGFYWEAHETWEGLWIASGRKGEQADFLKGLIKLAAAGVKAREGQSAGVQRHARRAAELFQTLTVQSSDQKNVYAGLNVEALWLKATSLADNPTIDDTVTISGRPVLSLQLTLVES